MPTLPRALTTELGVPSTSPTGQVSSAAPYEETAELAYPFNLAVYDRMRSTDAQQGGILRAIKLPIRGTAWRVPDPATPDVGAGPPAAAVRPGSPADLAERDRRAAEVLSRRTALGNTIADVDPRVRRFVESELGLTLDDQGRRRSRRGGVSWDEFLRHALLYLDFGHMPFEQVYAIGPHDVDGITGAALHLQKLAPRMPRSLSRPPQVATDGGLEGIWQTVPTPDRLTTREVFIPVDRLVMFCNEREGADWAGRSILRASYKHWLIKDVLIRLGALGVERTGMGLPVVTFPATGDIDRNRQLAIDIATKIRTGEDAGVALPVGWKVELIGVSGSTVDPLPQINYHDQAASKATLRMFLDLGHDAGARALGDTFVDVALASDTAVIRDVEETVMEHVVRDLVRWNFGPDEPYPPVLADDLIADTTPGAQDLATLANAQLLGRIDEALVREIRRRNRLPVPPPDDPLVTGDVGTGPTDTPTGAVTALPTTGQPADPQSGALPGTRVIAPQGVAVPALTTAASAGDLVDRAARVAALAASLHPVGASA